MRNTLVIIGGIVILVVLLGGAAFIGGRLLNTQAQAPSSSGGMIVQTSQQGGSRQTMKIETIPAKELPQEPAAIRGIFLRRQDSSVFIGTGQVQMMARKNSDGTMSMSSSHDGPDVEIVLTHDTTIYRDVTLKQFGGQPPPGEVKLQQVVEPGTLDEIGENSMLVVWGERRGDRVTATTVVYTLPAFLTKPAAGWVGQ